jgi:uncharacterized repeat protein (TIGR01451 family)
MEGMIELTAVAEIEQEFVNDQGEKEVRRVEANKVVPGDEVIYTIYYANVGAEPADDVIITNPIPEHMLFRGFMGDGTTVITTLSIDGGERYDQPDNLIVVNNDGQKRPAEPSDFTHVRWTLQEPLPPGAKGYVSFRAQLQ